MILAILFSQQFFSFLPSLGVLSEHEIPALDDIEHLFCSTFPQCGWDLFVKQIALRIPAARGDFGAFSRKLRQRSKVETFRNLDLLIVNVREHSTKIGHVQPPRSRTFHLMIGVCFMRS
jgi:hypothetical protein